VPSQGNAQLQQISADLSQPLQDVILAYGATQSRGYSPPPEREMQHGAPLDPASLTVSLDPSDVSARARSIVNASSAAAGGFDFYNGSPNSEARRAVQGQFIDPRDNQLYVTADPLAADHIYPQVAIKELSGFDLITRQQQDQVLNNLMNFQGLPQTFNSSKQGKLPSDWNMYKGQPLHPDYVQRNKTLEPKLRNMLQQQINEFLWQNGEINGPSE
jgi:hypothetical protein